MAGLYPDDVIASTLNRLGFVTGYGNTWRKHLVCSLRSKHNLPNYDPNNMSVAAKKCAILAGRKAPLVWLRYGRMGVRRRDITLMTACPLKASPAGRGRTCL